MESANKAKIFYGIFTPRLLNNKHTIMETRKLLQADYLDIIYDNRNKDYGGYELRKHYNQRATKAMLFLFSSLGILFLFTLINTHAPQTIIPTFQIPNILADIHPVEMPVLPPKVLPPAPPPAATASTHAFVVPKIVHTDEVTETPPSDPKPNGDSQPGLTTASGTTIGIGTNNTGTSGHGNNVIPVNLPPAEPVKWVQQMPQFDGDLNAWIGNHLKYPEIARSEGIEGQVVIQFVVNEDGSVSGAKIVRSIGGGCDEEALRMVSSMPKWKPGRNNGTAVKVYYSIPIRFVLN